MVAMGFHFSSAPFKKKNRWQLSIPNFVETQNQGAAAAAVNVLPPLKAGRPTITLKELSVEHLIETVYIPGKPDWGTLDITLFDIKCNKNPIFDWLKRLYNPRQGTYTYLITSGGNSFKIPQARLELLTGCGDIMESWVYEGVWAQKIEWGDLDMGSSEVVTVDLSLRYDRAWFDDPNDNNPIRLHSPITSEDGTII